MAALSSPAVAFLAVLGVAGTLPMHPTASQGLRPGDRLHQAAVKALAAGKLLVAARRLPDPNFGNAVILLADFNERWRGGPRRQSPERRHGGAGVPAPDADARERRPGVPRRAGREDAGDGAAARVGLSGGGAPRPRWRLPADGARGDRVRRHVQHELRDTSASTSATRGGARVSSKPKRRKASGTCSPATPTPSSIRIRRRRGSGRSRAPR